MPGHDSQSSSAASRVGRIGSRKRRTRVDLLIQRDGTQCTWCCREMIDAPILPGIESSLHMTLEHMVPLAKGGSDELSNLALACSQCNNERDQLDEFEPPWAIG